LRVPPPVVSVTVVSYHAHRSLLFSKLSSNDGVNADRRVVDDGFEDVRYMIHGCIDCGVIIIVDA
jgi:hypothetical protein